MGHLTIEVPPVLGESLTLPYTVGQPLVNVLQLAPVLLEALVNRAGQLNPYVRLYLDNQPVTLATPLGEKVKTLTIVSALSGG